MKIKILLISLFLFFGINITKNTEVKKIKIEWVKSLDGDFSFKSKKKSLNAEVWCYEYLEIDQIEIKKINNDTLECQTFINTATHSALKFYIVNDYVCNPRIELTGIVAGNLRVYPLKTGKFKLDKMEFKKQYIKADFDFEFLHEENPKQKMFWKEKFMRKSYSTLHNKQFYKIAWFCAR